MSELTDLLMGKVETPQATELKRQLARFMQDRVLVHNPTNDDISVKWDGWLVVVPAVTRNRGYGMGNMEMDRYLAIKYMSEIVNKMRFNTLSDAVEKENNRRLLAGMQEMNHHQERLVFETRILNDFNKPENIEAIRSQLYKGVTQKFGLDQVENTQDYVKVTDNPVVTPEMDFMFAYEKEHGTGGQLTPSKQAQRPVRSTLPTEPAKDITVDNPTANVNISEARDNAISSLTADA